MLPQCILLYGDCDHQPCKISKIQKTTHPSNQICKLCICTDLYACLTNRNVCKLCKTWNKAYAITNEYHNWNCGMLHHFLTCILYASNFHKKIKDDKKGDAK